MNLHKFVQILSRNILTNLPQIRHGNGHDDLVQEHAKIASVRHKSWDLVQEHTKIASVRHKSWDLVQEHAKIADQGQI